MARSSTLRLTEGGLLAAVTVVLGWLSAFVPYLNLILPAPSAILIYRHGIVPGVMSWLVAVTLVGLFMGNLPGAAFLALAGLISIGIGEPLRRRAAPGHVLGIALLAAVVWVVGVVVGSLWVSGINVLEVTFSAAQEGVNQAVELYRRLGVPEQQLESYRQMMSLSLQTLRVLAPALFFVSAVGTAYVNYWVVRLVLNRLGEKLPWFERFSRWRSSKLPAGLLLLGIALGMAGGAAPWLATVGQNLVVLGWLAAALQGMSLLWFWLDSLQAGWPLRALAVTFVLFFGPALLALAVMGAMDAWFNWRHL